jgi:hypothetical protein
VQVTITSHTQSICFGNDGSHNTYELLSMHDGQAIGNNSFTLDPALSDKDFASLDEEQLVRPRQANGDLPAMTFLHPADGNRLIDKGVEAGFPFRGARPDLRAFEQ